jgi:hypothetical protein
MLRFLPALRNRDVYLRSRVRIFSIPILGSNTNKKEEGKIRVADPDPDSIGSVDPDSESGSGSRRAKMTHKSRKIFKSSCIEVLDGLF